MNQRVTQLDPLLEVFDRACKPRVDWRVGIEAEHFGFILPAYEPVPYRAPHSVRTLFDELERAHHWKPKTEKPGGDVIALKHGHAALTLEPAAQLEVSGSPSKTVSEIHAELESMMGLVHEVSDRHMMRWIGIGFHPSARREMLPWVPKIRYPIMRDYMPTRGKLSLDMMQRTATVQTNLDYASEEDAMQKLRVSMVLQPVVTAMFANSPFYEGTRGKYLSQRAYTWLFMDADRSGILKLAFNPKARFVDYAEWALDVPMFFVNHNDTILHNTGQRFRDFMQNGFQGHYPTVDDWEQHLNTLFPEVRIKNTIETRGADSQAPELLCAQPALWRGLLYDAQALNYATALAERMTYEQVQSAREDIAINALKATLVGRRVAQWAEELYELAYQGLERLAKEDGSDDRVYLEPLGQLVEHGQCPADVLLARIDLNEPLLPQLVG